MAKDETGALQRRGRILQEDACLEPCGHVPFADLQDGIQPAQAENDRPLSSSGGAHDARAASVWHHGHMVQLGEPEDFRHLRRVGRPHDRRRPRLETRAGAKGPEHA